MRPISPVIWLSLLLLGCGGSNTTATNNNAPAVPPNPSGSAQITLLKAANPQSPWADVLVNCVQAETISQSCSLNTLPLIGMQSSEPDIDSIMDRVVVSHDWMATRFAQLLQRFPPDMRLMMRSLTAIVISHDVRPSYYTTGTGAIYLDPDDLWLTAVERDQVPTTPDYRSSFSDELAFVSLWRYVENFSYAWSSSRTAPRSLDDIEMPMAALLFHELAHANDFFAPSSMHLLQPRLSVYLNATMAADQRLSSAMSQPGSQTLTALARVMYFGDTPSQQQKQLTAVDVGAAFSLDTANAMYSYSNQYEDFAMLVEEVLMRHHYSLERDSGFTNRPPAGSPRSAYILQWGMRQRAFDPLVRQRAARAVQLLFNRSDVSAYFPLDAQSQRLTSGVSWDVSILSGAATEKAGAVSGSTANETAPWSMRTFLPFEPDRMAPATSN